MTRCGYAPAVRIHTEHGYFWLDRGRARWTNDTRFATWVKSDVHARGVMNRLGIHVPYTLEPV